MRCGLERAPPVWPTSLALSLEIHRLPNCESKHHIIHTLFCPPVRRYENLWEHQALQTFHKSEAATGRAVHTFLRSGPPGATIVKLRHSEEDWSQFSKESNRS